MVRAGAATGVAPRPCANARTAPADVSDADTELMSAAESWMVAKLVSNSVAICCVYVDECSVSQLKVDLELCTFCCHLLSP
jgi:hypothetical protein